MKKVSVLVLELFDPTERRRDLVLKQKEILSLREVADTFYLSTAHQNGPKFQLDVLS